MVVIPSGKNQLEWLIISSIIDTTWTEVVAAISERLLGEEKKTVTRQAAPQEASKRSFNPNNCI